MQVIGKANKYYTLWEVTKETRAGYDGRPYTATVHEYIKNISMDIEVVKAKYPGVTIDESLRGTRTFITSDYMPVEMPQDEFQYGKYRGTKVADCTDYDYLGWTMNNERDIIPDSCKELVDMKLVEQGWRRTNEMTILSPEAVKELDELTEKCEEYMELLDHGNPVEFTINSQIYFNSDEQCVTKIHNNIALRFMNFKTGFYKGYNYPIPCDSKGKGKKLRGCTITITKYTYTYEPNEYGWASRLTINVEDFTVNKR